METMIISLIVAAALYFTGRTLYKELSGGGCAGCKGSCSTEPGGRSDGNACCGGTHGH